MNTDFDDDDFCTDELDDIEEPTDDELDAIESASV